MESYWYRYSYVGIFTILFLAGYFYSTKLSKQEAKYILDVGLWAGGILIFMDYLIPSQDRKLTYFTAVFIVLVAFMLYLALVMEKERRRFKIILSGIWGFIIISELMYSTKLQMYHYHTSDIAEYQKYVENTENIIKSIYPWEEGGMYRISQTSTRNFDKSINKTANYNEALAFTYASLTGYVSSADNMQLEMLNRMGYRMEGDCIAVVNTSILGTDSLLGVKYVLSEYPINGLVEAGITQDDDKKQVYENPYCLPFAIVYEEVRLEEEKLNPFEYQNKLYSLLVGEYVELYKPLDYLVEENKEDHSRFYSIRIPDGNYAVYGNIPWKSNANASLEVNQIYQTAYAKWLSPSVFYIPHNVQAGNTTAFVELKAEKHDGICYGEEQFYVLDLDKMNMVSQILRNRAADIIEVKNGFAVFDVQTSKDMELYVSIPYNNGWSVTNNGEKVETGLFAGCMYSIPLKKGENTIKMTYHLPGVKVGAFGSLCGILLTIGLFFGEQYHKIADKKN